MKRPKPDADLTAWCKALAESTAPVDVVPPGWFSVSELSKKLKKPVPTLQQKMQHLLKAGKAERKIYRVRLEKTVRPVPHYKLK
jgi:predicted transcriptional regulator